MSAQEVRAGLALGSLFALRMIGLFVILPVFAVHAPSLRGGDDLLLVGIALGAYGLTQAILQIPYGMAADRYGRKRMIVIGLALFAAGSFIAAGAHDIWLASMGDGRMALGLAGSPPTDAGGAFVAVAEGQAVAAVIAALDLFLDLAVRDADIKRMRNLLFCLMKVKAWQVAPRADVHGEGAAETGISGH